MNSKFFDRGSSLRVALHLDTVKSCLIVKSVLASIAIYSSLLPRIIQTESYSAISVVFRLERKLTDTRRTT